MAYKGIQCQRKFLPMMLRVESVTQHQDGCGAIFRKEVAKLTSCFAHRASRLQLRAPCFVLRAVLRRLVHRASHSVCREREYTLFVQRHTTWTERGMLRHEICDTYRRPQREEKRGDQSTSPHGRHTGERVQKRKNDTMRMRVHDGTV